MASKGPLCHRRCEGLWCGALRAALHSNEPLGLHHKDLLMETCVCFWAPLHLDVGVCFPPLGMGRDVCEARADLP